MLTKRLRCQAAFSMIELIFVIIVLGIVSSITSQIVASVYDSYLTQRAIHRSSTQTELAALQLANRLAYSIPGTVIGRNNSLTPDFWALEDIPAGSTDYTTLEWIGYDADGFGAVIDADLRPTWSGYADVNNSTINALTTTGSRLTQANTIINNLRANGSGTTIADAAILFPSNYTAYTIGYFGGLNANDIHPVAGVGDDTTLNLDATATGTRDIKEHYKLAWSAYAVVPVRLTDAQAVARGFNDTNCAGSITDCLWDLQLVYDYQPWDGERLSANNGTQVTLLRNVSVFKFTGSGGTIRFKICQRESVGGQYSINTCKEKAVIR